MIASTSRTCGASSLQKKGHALVLLFSLSRLRFFSRLPGVERTQSRLYRDVHVQYIPVDTAGGVPNKLTRARACFV